MCVLEQMDPMRKDDMTWLAAVHELKHSQRHMIGLYRNMAAGTGKGGWRWAATLAA